MHFQITDTLSILSMNVINSNEKSRVRRLAHAQDAAKLHLTTFLVRTVIY